MATSVPTSSLDGFHQTAQAQHADEQVRALFDALNRDDDSGFDAVVARNFLSYDYLGMRTRNGYKRHYRALRESFHGFHHDVHENIGVVVEDDLVGVRTVISGRHTGDYAGHGASGKDIATSASHIFRLHDGRIVEHWQVLDTYRILVQIGAITSSASKWQELLGAPQTESPLFDERPGTEFGAHGGRGSPEESRRAQKELWDGLFATGDKEDSAVIAEDLISNSGWIPDGREPFVDAIAAGRAKKPDGRANPTHIVAEGGLIFVRSAWDGTMLANGVDHDASSVDIFRLEVGLLKEHWETVDQLRLYQDYGVLDPSVKDA